MLFTIAACAVDPELQPELEPVDDVAVSEQALLATGATALTVARGECGVDVADAEIDRLRAGLANDLLPRARTVANSPAFRSCLLSVFTVGRDLRIKQWNSPGELLRFGPYQPWPDDLGFNATRFMPLDRMRDLATIRATSEASSPHPLDIRCMNPPGGLAFGLPPSGDFSGPEDFFLSRDFFHPDPAAPTNRGFRAQLAGTIWHEVMHERDYWHEQTDPLPDSYRGRLPVMVGACMDQVYAKSEQFCLLSPCPGGFSALTALDGDSGSCACVKDPGQAPTPTLVDSWTWPGLLKVAVNAAGEPFAVAVDANGAKKIYARSGHTWNVVASGDDVIAGGDAMSYRVLSITGQPLTWVTKSRVGASQTTPTTAGETVMMDGFAGLVRLANGRVSRKRAGESWIDYGPAVRVATNSDVIYAATSTTATARLDSNVANTASQWVPIGNTTGALTVDTYGTLYNLAPDQLSMWKHRGDHWDWIGGQDNLIAAGDSMFARSTVTGLVYRRAPDNNWYGFAACTTFAVGGRSVYCLNGSTLQAYEY